MVAVSESRLGALRGAQSGVPDFFQQLSPFNYKLYRTLSFTEFEGNQICHSLPFTDMPSVVLLGGGPLGIEIFQTAITFYLSTSHKTSWYQI